MPDPFSDPSDSTNGARSPDQDVNGYGDLSAKLPQPRSPERGPGETVTLAVQRDVRRTFLVLLLSGLLIGALTAAGVVWVMHQLNLIGVPEQQERS